MRKDGLSELTSESGFLDMKKILPTLSSVIIANIPQVLITIGYFCYNGALTTMLATAEFSPYGIGAKHLRVI